MAALVASTEAGAGRTVATLALALAKAVANRELDVGYTKPVGISPGAAAGGAVGRTDADGGAMLEADDSTGPDRASRTARP
jgi:dethiobiotin synthetase